MTYPYYPQNYMQNYPQSYPQVAQTPQPTTDMNWVQGEAGAKGYHVSPNTTVTLWDSEAQTIYVKSANAVGVPTITILDYQIRNQKPLNEPQTGFATQDEVESLKKVIDGKEAQKVWEVMDELMETLNVINPRLYRGVLVKLAE